MTTHIAGVAFWLTGAVAGALADWARTDGAWNRAKLKADRATKRVFFIIMILVSVKVWEGGKTKSGWAGSGPVSFEPKMRPDREIENQEHQNGHGHASSESMGFGAEQDL